MSEMRVTFKELRNKAAELRQLNNRFKKVVEEMVSNEQSLVNMWDGAAKDEFHKAFNSDKSQMDLFYANIETYCQALENSADEYEQAEQKNTATASSRSYR